MRRPYSSRCCLSPPATIAIAIAVSIAFSIAIFVSIALPNAWNRIRPKDATAEFARPIQNLIVRNKIAHVVNRRDEKAQ
jgi:hypothetical protein